MNSVKTFKSYQKKPVRLKDPSLVPPNGFVYRSQGKVYRDYSKHALARRFSKDDPNIEDIIDRHTAEYLYETMGSGADTFVDYYRFVPSVKKQIGSNGTVTDIDSSLLLPAGYHYNPSHEYVYGSRYFVYRRQQLDGKSDLCGCLLDDNFVPVKGTHVPILIPNYEQRNHYEDPRLFIWRNELWICYNVWGGDWKKYQPTVWVAKLDKKMKITEQHMLRIGENGIKTEKNWQFFERGEDLFCSYGVRGHVVYPVLEDMTVGEPIVHDWVLPWSSDLRGGTPPKAITYGKKKAYLSFFHGHELLDNTSTRPRVRRYNMGAYVFDAKTFKPLAATPEPLLIASEEDKSLTWAPFVVFPGSGILRGDVWEIALGVNDLYSTILKVSAQYIESKLEPL